MSICKDCGKDLIGHPTACEPVYIKVNFMGKGKPAPFHLEPEWYDEEIATLKAEKEEWRRIATELVERHTSSEMAETLRAYHDLVIIKGSL